jgi:NADH-quinone oxidoreductase subunit N
MNVGAFAFILSMERDGRPVAAIDALNQFGKAEPGKALAVLVLMFSLAGVPPFLGFFAKYSVLMAAVDAGMTEIAVAGVVASVIGAFYYLRIVYLMYFGRETEGVESRMSAPQWVLLMGASAAMLLGVVNLFGIEGPALAAAQALVR